MSTFAPPRKTKSGTPNQSTVAGVFRRFRLSRQKIALCNQKTRSDRDWQSSLQHTQPWLPSSPLSLSSRPARAAPKARAARTLRASTFNGLKVAQPKVRAGRRTLCRGKTPLHGACDIFHLLIAASARAFEKTVALAGRNPACGARADGTRGIPSWRSRSERSCFDPRDPRQARIGPVAFRRRRSFPRRLPWRSWKHRRAAFFFFFDFLRNAKTRVCKVATHDALVTTRRESTTDLDRLSRLPRRLTDPPFTPFTPAFTRAFHAQLGVSNALREPCPRARTQNQHRRRKLKTTRTSGRTPRTSPPSSRTSRAPPRLCGSPAPSSAPSTPSAAQHASSMGLGTSNVYRYVLYKDSRKELVERSTRRTRFPASSKRRGARTTLAYGTETKQARLKRAEKVTGAIRRVL